MSRDLPEFDRYRGNNSVLVLFAPERTHPSYIDATEQLSRVVERLDGMDIRVLSVFATGRVYEQGERLTTADASAWRRRFGANREAFTAVLLDENGEIKLRQERELSVPSVIGAMPPSSRTRH